MIKEITNYLIFLLTPIFFKTRGDHYRKQITLNEGTHFGYSTISVPFNILYYHSFLQFNGRAIFDRSTFKLKQILWDHGRTQNCHDDPNFNIRYNLNLKKIEEYTSKIN